MITIAAFIRERKKTGSVLSAILIFKIETLRITNRIMQKINSNRKADNVKTGKAITPYERREETNTAAKRKLYGFNMTWRMTFTFCKK